MVAEEARATVRCAPGFLAGAPGAASHFSGTIPLLALQTGTSTLVGSSGRGTRAHLRLFGSSADLLDATLTTTPFQKSGYTFTFNTGSGVTYSINADAMNQNTTGVRHFFTDQTGVLHYNVTATAAATDSPL